MTEQPNGLWQRIRRNLRGPAPAQPADGTAAAINSARLKAFGKKYWWVILIIIPLLIGTHLRIQPAYLPITDDWATNTVHNFYRNSITQQVTQQYPNVPEAQRNALVDKELAEFLEENKERAAQEITQVSEQFKSQLQDDTGQTYLLDIDTYLWYGQAKNYERYGHAGNTVQDGQNYYTLRNGRIGQAAGFSMISWLIYAGSTITGANILASHFYLSSVIIGIAIILSFFIGRRLAGNAGGFVAALLFAVHPALLGRTITGDTDILIALFEILCVFFFVYAATSTTRRQTLTYSTLTGVALAGYVISHKSWWHIYDFMLGAFGIGIVYLAFVHRAQWRQLHKNENVQKLLLLITTLSVSGVVFGLLFARIISSTLTFTGIVTAPFRGPLSFLTLKSVGVQSIWPNVLTTVAELNTSNTAQVISQLGGQLLFALSMIGIVFLFVRGIMERSQQKVLLASFLALWFIGSLYAAQSSLRFIAFLVPSFAFGIGAFVTGLFVACEWLSKNIKVTPLPIKVVGAITVGFLLLPLWTPAIATATNQIPHMNDAWYETLTHIKQNSTDAIITSWWDFGHWFVAIAERRVTFDGGNQGERIHWVGSSLLTDNEDTSVGILRMLNCAQEEAPHTLSTYLGGTLETDVEAIDLLYTLLPLDREGARQAYLDAGLDDEQTQTMLELTHCQDIIPQYFITSEDMVSKTPVWAHFGSWNFSRALMYNKVKALEREDGVRVLRDEFSLEAPNAEQIYQEIQTTDADQWISPWPRYLSGVAACQTSSATATCNQNIQGTSLSISIDLATGRATLPNNMSLASAVLPTQNGTIEIVNRGTNSGFSIALIPTPNGFNSILSSPELANSMFTRLFFMEGHGLKHFDRFDDKRQVTGGRILTWTVDFDGNERNIHPALIEKEIVGAGDTVSVNYIGAHANGTLFDSSIANWRLSNITLDSSFDEHPTNTFSFVAGTGQVVPGFDQAVIGMKNGEEKVVTISPEQAYGTDPQAHPLGNKTLTFKLRVERIT